MWIAAAGSAGSGPPPRLTAAQLPPPPARGDGGVEQPVEVAVDRRGGEPGVAQALLGAAVLEPDLHREVGEQRLGPLEGAAAAAFAAPQQDRMDEAAV